MPTPDDYVTCRTFGHAWFEYDTNWVPIFGTPITLRCERCGGERRDIIDARGMLGRRYYVMPEGYFYASGSDRPTRAEFRLMLIDSRRRKTRKGEEGRRMTKHLLDTPDAREWAAEFMRLFDGWIVRQHTWADHDHEIDEGLMIGWFANAIETGRRAGQVRAKDPGLSSDPAESLRYFLRWMYNNSYLSDRDRWEEEDIDRVLGQYWSTP